MKNIDDDDDDDDDGLWQAHVVAAFEQSLSNMTQRLQQLTVTSQQKVLIIMSLCLSVCFSVA